MTADSLHARVKAIEGIATAMTPSPLSRAVFDLLDKFLTEKSKGIDAARSRTASHDARLVANSRASVSVDDDETLDRDMELIMRTAAITMVSEQITRTAAITIVSEPITRTAAITMASKPITCTAAITMISEPITRAGCNHHGR